MKDFSRKKVLRYAAKVIIFRKRCKIQTLLLETTNRPRRSHSAISDNSSPIINVFKCDLSYSCAAADTRSTDLESRSVRLR